MKREINFTSLDNISGQQAEMCLYTNQNIFSHLHENNIGVEALRHTITMSQSSEQEHSNYKILLVSLYNTFVLVLFA